jgi:hypothetical protein
MKLIYNYKKFYYTLFHKDKKILISLFKYYLNES